MGDEGQIVFPEVVREVINTIPESWGWGPPETVFGWPEGADIEGHPIQTDLYGPPTLRRGRKFFVQPDLHPSWAAVLRRDSGYWLRMAWRPDELPYLGLWVDEGALNHETVATPEPTTGWYDDLSLAFAKGEVLTAPAYAKREWELTVRAGCGNPSPDD
jgi:hypothetical protein